MSKEGSREIMNQVNMLCANAEGAYEREDTEAMDIHLCQLRDILDDCYDRTGEEAPEQQQDDSEEKESTDDKGCVDDSPHAGHCVKP